MGAKSRNIKSSPVCRGVKAGGRLLKFKLSMDEDDLIYLSLSEADRNLRREFMRQVYEAFSSEPSLNSVIDGQREIKLGKHGSRSGTFPSTKNAQDGMSVVYLKVESRPEGRYALELERDENVHAFRTQAIKLKLPGANSEAFPDFLVMDKAGYLHIREVKQDRDYLNVDQVDRIRHLVDIFSRWGISYAVVDVSDLPPIPKFENLMWLHQRTHSHPSHEEKAEFLQLPFVKNTYGELKALAVSVGLDDVVVSYLLFTEELHAYWGKRLNEESEVWR